MFDLHGHLVDKAQVDITSYQSPQPGWVENDSEEFWRALCQACQRLWANTLAPKTSIRGVVITTQRATVINLDSRGQPLRPAIVWLDQRRADTRPRFSWWWELAFRAIGMRDTGIPEGLPVIAGAADKACEVIGAGCLTPEIACLSFGTAATINTTTTPRYLEATPFIPPYQAAVPGYYNTEIQITRGFWMVNWFKEQFGLHEEIEARSRGVAPESLFDELVNAVPAGAMGLMLQPFWNPGIKMPGPEAKGAVIGFGDVHTRAHLYRAILEGLATAVREMTRVGQVFHPEPQHVRIYEQLYRKVYCRMYRRLQPLYRDIREITGYPGPER
ncbi:MAG: FGGY family carbohydrate kinase [Sulfuritalea sp.]|nr:FGGY family carbohydrate kinase [Sulfuritalea sp.]